MMIKQKPSYDQEKEFNHRSWACPGTLKCATPTSLVRHVRNLGFIASSGMTQLTLDRKVRVSASLYIQIKKNSAIRHIQHELPTLVGVRLFYLGSITVTPCLQASPYSLFSRKYRMSLHETGPWHSLFFAHFFFSVQSVLFWFLYYLLSESSPHLLYLSSVISTAILPSFFYCPYFVLVLSVTSMLLHERNHAL